MVSDPLPRPTLPRQEPRLRRRFAHPHRAFQSRYRFRLFSTLSNLTRGLHERPPQMVCCSDLSMLSHVMSSWICLSHDAQALRRTAPPRTKPFARGLRRRQRRLHRHIGDVCLLCARKPCVYSTCIKHALTDPTFPSLLAVCPAPSTPNPNDD